MTREAVSRNGVAIRLTDERWTHIVEEHSELAGMREEVLNAVEEADRVLAAREGALLAVRHFDESKAFVVVYREVTDRDGFIITAFLTSRLTRLDRREQLWPPKTSPNTANT